MGGPTKTLFIAPMSRKIEMSPKGSVTIGSLISELNREFARTAEEKPKLYFPAQNKMLLGNAFWSGTQEPRSVSPLMCLGEIDHRN
jgi:hypothetical protein